MTAVLRRGCVVLMVLTAAVVGGVDHLAPVPAGAAASSQTPSDTVTVDVRDNVFAPKRVEIVPGTTVRWVNHGRSRHNVVPNRGSDFGSNIPADGRYEFTFSEPGTYAYYCSLHGAPGVGQRGTVVVVDPAAAHEDRSTSNARRRGGTLRVPDDFPTIQQAVDAAKPGALVLVAPGVYHEAITVGPKQHDIVIRGEDRNETIVDGEFSEEPGHENGFKVFADGVAIENITARNFKTNGFFWTGVRGYRGSYLNAIRNGDYGIFAFDSVDGQFDHSYAAGSPDAGFYIGQCFPCNAVIIDVEAEWNGIGYSGTNSGGNLVIARSSFHDNRVGIVPNSGTGEALYPQHGTTIVGNEVYSNNNASTGAIEIAEIAIGNGILVAGGNENVVTRNLVYDHDIAGIGVIALPETIIDPDNPEAIDFDAKRNTVRSNVVRDSARFDLLLVSTLKTATDDGRNCFADNAFETSLPSDLEALVPCTGEPVAGFENDLVTFNELLGGVKPPGVDYRTASLPDLPQLENMPRAKTARPRPATKGATIVVRLATVKLPDATR